MPYYLPKFSVLMVKTACTLLCVTIVVFFSCAVFSSQKVVFESTANPPSLLEMYSSHGCSSCPPAQALIDRFTDSPDLWNKIIPIVFHVDYWDYIGWKDPFSSARYSKRQRMLKQRGAVHSVYTPGFVLNGREWKGWYNGRSLSDEELHQFSVTKLTAALTPQQVEVKYSLADPKDNVEGNIHIAILGFDLETHVSRGENADQILSDNFIVLGYRQKKLTDVNQLLKYPTLKTKANKYAAVIWTTNRNSFTPTQVVGGFLPETWQF